MLKKITLLLFTLFFIQAANAGRDDELNLEKIEACKTKNIKKWMASKYSNKKKIVCKIQGLIFEGVIENSNAQKRNKFIHDRRNLEKTFGTTTCVVPDFLLTVLSHINKVSKRKSPVVCEFGFGLGDLSLLVPFAFHDKGEHYAIESKKEFVRLFKNRRDHTFKDILGNKRVGALSRSVKILEEDCLGFANRHERLCGRVDVIVIKFFDQMLNPDQHRRLMKQFELLLAPGGKVFICSETPRLYDVVNPRCDEKILKHYKKRLRSGEPYPGFLKYEVMAALKLLTADLLDGCAILDEERLSDNAEVCSLVTGSGRVTHDKMSWIKTEEKVFVMEVSEIVRNFFTIDVYHNLLKKHRSLEFEGGFYTSCKGGISNVMSSDSPLVVVVIKKKGDKKKKKEEEREDGRGCSGSINLSICLELGGVFLDENCGCPIANGARLMLSDPECKCMGGGSGENQSNIETNAEEGGREDTNSTDGQSESASDNDGAVFHSSYYEMWSGGQAS